MLFTDINNVREYVPVNAGMDISHLQPYINKIERDVLRDKIIGTTEYTSLTTNYPGSLTAAQTALLPYVRDMVINLALHKYVETGSVQISDVITVPMSEQAQVLSLNRKEDLKRTFLIDGYKAMENLLKFLWAASSGDYAGYDASTQRTEMRKLLVLNSEEFAKGFFLHNGYYAYYNLRSAIERAEELYLEPAFGIDYYTELKTEVKNNTVSTDNAVIINMIHKALPPLAIFIGINELGIKVDELGVNVEGLSDRENVLKKDPLALTDQTSIVARAERIGQSFIGKIRSYLNANASVSKYATFFASDAYVSETDREDETLFLNKEDSGFFVV